MSVAPIRTLLADDEPPARARLRRALVSAGGFEVVAESGTGPETLHALSSGDVELAFLDVRMPGFDGLDALRRTAPEARPAVVFATAHDAFAVAAFEVHALDYLLKPFEPVRLSASLQRAARAVAARRGGRHHPGLDALIRSDAARDGVPEHLVGRAAGSTSLVPVADVEAVEAAGNYLRLHTAGRSYLQRATLRSVERLLEPAGFVRAHRSWLVARRWVRELRSDPRGLALTLQSGRVVRCGRRYAADLRRAFR